MIWLKRQPWRDKSHQRRPSEVSRGQFNSSRACLMPDIMNACGVMDLEMVGGSFTWRKIIQAGGHAAWMSHPDYAALVQHTWVSTIGNVHRKLDYIQKKSTKFNERVLGDIFKRNCQIEARIKGVHKQLDTFPYSHFIIWRNNFRPNIIRYSIRSEFCGIKNQGNNGLSLITRIPHFSIHKQSSEEEEIGYYTLILEVFGVLMIRS
ncbi:hypothetical protein GLYMA_06G165550v4 [Glycine max]|nr:hypothetical protein GLYMA_06G165550v4 [Glycine max]